MFFKAPFSTPLARIYLATALLKAPFWALYQLLTFILYKELHASAFEIATFTMLQPVVSIFSIYWGDWIHRRADRIKLNIIVASWLGYLPFLILPWYASRWFVIVCAAFFMLFQRGVVPAWMELFNRHLTAEGKSRTFAWGSIVSHTATVILPFALFPLLDYDIISWRWLFFMAAACAISSCIVQKKLPTSTSVQHSHTKVSQMLITPWVRGLAVWKQQRTFRTYLIGFMGLAGSGLMILQPALPKFFIDYLNLNYTELGIARSCCKGIAFIVTAPLWANKMSKVNFFLLSSYICALGALFPLMLCCSMLLWPAVFVAYLLYGFMQAGSELVWHLSGPYFAKQQESSAFTNLNILIIGLRGLIIPQIGAALLYLIAPAWILGIAALFSCAGMLWLYTKKKLVQSNLQS